MAHDFDSVRPIGGLNYEDEVRAIPEGDYLYAENIRNSITAANKGKTLTNVLGNLKIQQYNCPYNGGAFPSGKNRCIGAVEDIVNNGAIYMVWNSEGKQGIYRYYRDKTDPSNPYGVVEQVMQYNFGWTKRTRVTSMNIAYGDPAASGRGDLLYWCDPTPKKINLTKGNICSKYKTWNVVLPKSFAGTSIFFQVIVRAFLTNAPIASINVTVSAAQSISEIMTSIASQINAGLSTYISAEACDCSITITEKAINGYDVVFSDSIFYVIPDNWYGKTLIDRFWDRCKWQPMQAPQPEYGKDENFGPNYVIGKVFQFRLQYLYDDGEPSALGVWSQIAINNLGCDGTNNPEDNYVDVNFNDPLLLDTATLVLLKKVRVIARELNTGNDRSILDLEPCEFLDYSGAAYAHYKFYNNVETLPIDAILAAKLYDDVPLESGAEILSNNRMVELNCLTGYDAPDCVAASCVVDFDEVKTPPLYKVKFYVRVLTYGLSDQEQPQSPTSSAGRNFYEFFPKSLGFDKYPFWQHANPDVNYSTQRGGIFRDISSEGTAFFGGGSFGSGGGGDFGITGGMDTTYDQRIPEGGFTIYAAGTNFFGITKQKNIGLDVDGDGALDISSESQINRIGTYLYSLSNNDIYHEVEMILPEGEYVFRVASHWCSFGDKIGKGFAYDLNGMLYQKTSTNVWGTYAPGSGTTPMYSANSFKKSYEIKLNVTSDISDAGTFLIMDVSPPWDIDLDGGKKDSWRGINAYLVDSFGNTDVNGSAFNGVTVEKTALQYEQFTGWSGYYITDHNGYFCGIIASLFYNSLSISAYQINTQIIVTLAETVYYGGLTEYYTKTLTPYVFDGVPPDTFLTHNDLIYGIVPTDNINARGICSTFVSGKVVNSIGAEVNNALVVYENGRVDRTNVSGNYLFIAWGDMLTPNIGNFSTITNFTYGTNRTVDNLILSVEPMCVPTYPSGQEIPSILITPIGSGPSDYNPSNPYIVGNFIVDEALSPDVKTIKRGGNYNFGIRLYDDAGRLCSVIPAFDLYIPFITEDLSDSFPDQYPTGTYIHGKPSITWSLSPSTTFPDWVATMQWMVTKNTIYGRYLQWVANSVTYLSVIETETIPEIQTSYQNSDAVAIKISLSNIVEYASLNANSQVGYSFEEGDRLRLIANRNAAYIDGIYDFEIFKVDPIENSVYVKPGSFVYEIQSGTLFEIYNAKSIQGDHEQVYYEVGEVINVSNGIPEKYSDVFTFGDTYWRGRYIPVNDDASNFAAVYPVVIEDASISDFYPSQAQDIGRIGIVDPNFKQIRRPMLLKASNQFIPATAVNGLSSFEALNEKELDRANGAIQRAVAINQYIVAISNVRETSNYIQVVTFQQATLGQGVLAIADQFFGTAYPHAKTLGTDLPASVFINDGQIFGFHSKRADAWLYRGDGETTISDKKMKNYFRKLSASGVSDAVAVYDRFHEEYILTVWRIYSQQTTVDVVTATSGGYNITVTISSGNPQPTVGEDVSYKYYQNGQWQTGEGEITSIVIMLDGSYQVRFATQTSLSIRIGGQISVSYSSPETISWFNGSDAMDKNGWATFYSFTPEAYCQMGSNILSFKDGEVWIHGENSTRNNFYGEQYVSKVTPVFNDKPEYLKVWNSCILMQYQDNNENNWSAPVIQNNNGQLSRLKEGSWVKKGEHWYAAFKRDLNDLSVNQAIRISQGRALRSTSLTAELENGYTGEVTLYGWLANWTNSERTSK